MKKTLVNLALAALAACVTPSSKKPLPLSLQEEIEISTKINSSLRQAQNGLELLTYRVNEQKCGVERKELGSDRDHVQEVYLFKCGGELYTLVTQIENVMDVKPESIANARLASVMYIGDTPAVEVREARFSPNDHGYSFESGGTFCNSRPRSSPDVECRGELSGFKISGLDYHTEVDRFLDNADRLKKASDVIVGVERSLKREEMENK